MLTWNRKAFLETLFSDFYKKIDNKNYNFFIIDNGSTDGTQEFLKELATKDSKIQRFILRLILLIKASDRVKKLMISTNISGKRMKASNYNFIYTFGIM